MKPIFESKVKSFAKCPNKTIKLMPILNYKFAFLFRSEDSIKAAVATEIQSGNYHIDMININWKENDIPENTILFGKIVESRNGNIFCEISSFYEFDVDTVVSSFLFIKFIENVIHEYEAFNGAYFEDSLAVLQYAYEG